MYRIAFIIFLITSQNTFALNSQLKNQYIDFKKNYTELLILSKNKAQFQKIYELKVKDLKNRYDLFSKLEKNEITREGNQMALDIEMLEPLNFLVSSRINSEACSEAFSLNEMNSTSDTINFKIIKETLIKLCK